MSENLQKIDHSALRVNQAVIILLSILAFIFNQPWLALLVGLVMGIGTLLKIPGFGLIYRQLLKPSGWVKPDVLWDNPEPHRFAQGLGSVFLFGSQPGVVAAGFHPGLGAGLAGGGAGCPELLRRLLRRLHGVLLAQPAECARISQIPSAGHFPRHAPEGAKPMILRSRSSISWAGCCGRWPSSAAGSACMGW